MLKVKNNNDFDLKDRFNGIDYIFPAGQSAILDDDAARHIFGFGDADKAPYLTRLGWVRTTGDFDMGMRLLEQFVFSPADYADPNEIQPQEQGLAPLQPGAEGDGGTDGSLESSVPTPPDRKGKGRSVLNQLSGG